MINQKKPMEIVRQTGVYRCVKLNRKYYCIAYDEAADLTYAIIPSDRVVGEYRSFRGYSHAAVEYVAKGRKRQTAVAYFNHFLRTQKAGGGTVSPIVKQEAAHDDGAKSADIQCNWCNDSGVDPRNEEWSCAKC